MIYTEEKHIQELLMLIDFEQVLTQFFGNLNTLILETQ